MHFNMLSYKKSVARAFWPRTFWDGHLGLLTITEVGHLAKQILWCGKYIIL